MSIIIYLTYFDYFMIYDLNILYKIPSDIMILLYEIIYFTY